MFGPSGVRSRFTSAGIFDAISKSPSRWLCSIGVWCGMIRFQFVITGPCGFGLVLVIAKCCILRLSLVSSGSFALGIDSLPPQFWLSWSGRTGFWTGAIGIMSFGPGLCSLRFCTVCEINESLGTSHVRI